MGRFLAIDAGKTSIEIVHGENSFDGEPASYPASDYWSEEGLIRLVRDYVSGKDFGVKDVEVVGLAVPGVVDRQEKVIINDVRDTDIKFSELEKALSTEIRLANDADVTVLGRDKEVENLVNIVVGSGVGAGVEYNGKVLWSSRNGSIEPGFSFTGTEIWQNECSGNGIQRRVNEWLKEEERNTALGEEISDTSTLFKVQEDEVAADYRKEIEDAMARGIANVVNCYAPEFVGFTGSVAENNPEFIRKSFSQASEHFYNPQPELDVAKSGQLVALKGALELAREGY